MTLTSYYSITSLKAIERQKMEGFVKFMRGIEGRAMRAVLGVAMITYGFMLEQSVIVGLLGFVPVICAGVNACLFGPLFGYTVWGEKKARSAQ
jgi:hypothetical protein